MSPDEVIEKAEQIIARLDGGESIMEQEVDTLYIHLKEILPTDNQLLKAWAFIKPVATSTGQLIENS